MIAEFTVYGIFLSIHLSDSLTLEEHNQFWRQFIRDAIEENLLTYGGLNEGFVCSELGRSLIEDDREKVRVWLSSRAEVIEFKVGELVDANPNPREQILYPLLPE